jgi:hypothetical protein
MITIKQGEHFSLSENNNNKKNIVKKEKAVKNYINGRDFYNALVEHDRRLKNCQDDKKPQISRYIGECILKIAEKLATKFNFVNYSFREEMVLDAIEKMIASVEKYDITYSAVNPNPLGYFTQIAWNVFLQRIAREKLENYIKHKNFEKINLSSINEFNEFEGMFDNEEHVKVIDNFEATKDKKKSAGYAKHTNLDYEKNKIKKKDKNETTGTV